jgi:hypothetical protein
MGVHYWCPREHALPYYRRLVTDASITAMRAWANSPLPECPIGLNLDYANRSRTFSQLGIAILHKSKKFRSDVLHGTGPDVAQTVNTTGYVLLRARGPVRVT